MPKRCLFAYCCLVLFLCGCSDSLPESVTGRPESQQVLAQAFNPADSGAIRGRVLWDGDIPKGISTEIRAIAYHNALHKNPIRYETTHLPKVDAQGRGVEDAVVLLRGVDPRRARPWDHPEARVEFRDRKMCVFQGQQLTGAAFVRRGAKLETINREVDFHALRGRGAAFFTLPLIKADLPSTQILDQTGLVELFDAGGYYWSHAHCFVDDHPYFARTDANGNFTLDQVPAGTYEIVAWLPDWHILRKERDPETGILVRQVWGKPREQNQTVRVNAQQTSEINFSWSQAMFE